MGQSENRMNGRNRRRTAITLSMLLVAVLIGFSSCGGGGHHSVAPGIAASHQALESQTAIPQPGAEGPSRLVHVLMQPQPTLDAPPEGISLPAPSEELALLPEATGARYTEEDLLRAGAAYEDILPHNRVSRSGDDVTFNSEMNDGEAPASGELSFDTYRLSLKGYDGNETIGFTWELPDCGCGANRPDFRVGFADFPDDDWDWYEGPRDDVLTIESYAPYTTAEGDVLLVIVLVDPDEYTLKQLTIGAYETRGLGDIWSEGEPLFLDETHRMPSGESAGERAVSALPAAIDLSDNCSPVRDQGQVGSCTAFAAGGAYDYELFAIYRDYGWNHLDDYNLVSPKWIYRNTGSGCPHAGRNTAAVVNFLMTDGTSTELNCPYKNVCDYDWGPEAIADAEILRIDDWWYVFWIGWDPDDVSDIQQVLAEEKRVLVMRTNVDANIFGYQPGEVWNYEGPTIGGHAMVVVGYDNAKSAFKVRNSWSASWGDHGYLWIGYETFMNPAAQIYCCKLKDSYNPAAAARFLGLTILTDVDPDSAVTGTEVTVSGYNFGDSQGASELMFLGASGWTQATINEWQDEEIAAVVPDDAITGPIKVYVNDKETASDFDFVVLPHIDALNPATQIVGQNIAVEGSGFGVSANGDSRVEIGDVEATVVSWANDEIEITIPPDVTQSELTVTVTAGTSNGVEFTPYPNIDALSPAVQIVGGNITVEGTSFGDSPDENCKVEIGGIEAGVVSWSDTAIEITIPAGVTQSDLTVTTSVGTTNGVEFTPKPNIAGIYPARAYSGKKITLTGTSFGDEPADSKVTFGGSVEASPEDILSWGENEIALKVPAGAESGDVTVTVGGVDSAGVYLLVVLPPPVIEDTEQY